MDETMIVDANGLRFHTRVWGPADGEPLLLLHGASGSAAVWEPVVAALSRRWRVHAPDMRGHGASTWPGEYSFEAMRDDVGALLDALGIRGCLIARHSMGGVAAHLLAAAKPEPVGGLVLIETPPPVPLGLSVPARPDGGLDYDWDLRPRLIAQLNAPVPDWWEGLERITAPTLVIGGGERSFLPQQRIAEMAARIPGAAHTEIPVGHGIVAAAPEELAAAIESRF